MNLWSAFPVLLTEFLCTTLLIAALAYSTSFPLMMTITFVLGFVVQGAQGGLSAVAATFYPDLDPLDRNRLVPWSRTHRIDCGPHARRRAAEAGLEPARNFAGRIDSRSVRRERNLP